MRLLLISSLLFIVFSYTTGQNTVGLIQNDYRSFNGYTLFNPMPSTKAYLIDNCGYVVHSWQSSYPPLNIVYLLENGDLLRTCRTNTIPGAGGRLEIIDWDGNLTWAYNFPDSVYSFHHDIEPMPNGNILVISLDKYTPEQAIEEGRNPLTLEAEFYSEKILEIKPIGADSMEVVWEWKAWDHMVQDFDATKNNYGIVENHPELLDINYWASTGPNALTDWIHFNAINYNHELDQIMLCSRNLCEVYIIDHSTTTAEAASPTGGIYGKGGDILYRYGNPEAYRKGTLSDRTLFFQHDAHWIPQGSPDEGKIMIFNNQYQSNSSSVVMIEPPQDSAGFYTPPGNSAWGPASFAWEFVSDEFYAPRISGVQQQPNGNILICAGPTGEFGEVDKNGNLLWKYINPVQNSGIASQGEVPVLNNVFKIARFSPDYPAFNGKQLEVGAPVELNPWPYDCNIIRDTSLTIHIMAMLEGPFNGSNMSVQNEFIPLHQPFNTSPWNYDGTEKLNYNGSDVVDWVLLELRDASDPENAQSDSTIMMKAALLKENGLVVETDGVSWPAFNNSYVSNLYLVIHHRNHLSVMSTEPSQPEAAVLSIDFINSPNTYLGGEAACKELKPGVYGLISGDGNADKMIDQNDETGVWKLEAGNRGYQSGDFNNNGQVDNADKNDLLFKNHGKSGYVPD